MSYIYLDFYPYFGQSTWWAKRERERKVSQGHPALQAAYEALHHSSQSITCLVLHYHTFHVIYTSIVAAASSLMHTIVPMITRPSFHRPETHSNYASGERSVTQQVTIIVRLLNNMNINFNHFRAGPNAKICNSEAYYLLP